MIQIQKKWKVTVTVGSGVITFWVSDNFLSNVMRTVANIEFSSSGLNEQPKSIAIIEDSLQANPQVTSTRDYVQPYPHGSGGLP